MICPKCKSEYIDGVVICPDCTIDLVDVLPPVAKENGTEKDDIDDRPWEFTDNQPVLLTVRGNNFEAGQIKAFLEDSNIPVMIKHRGSDQYLTVIFGSGGIFSGLQSVEIYVPENALEKAKQLIEVFDCAEIEFDEYDDEEEYE